MKVVWTVAGLVVLLVAGLVLLPSNTFGPRDTPLRVASMSCMKQVSRALILYSEANDDRYPAVANWNDRVLPYLKAAPNPEDANHVFTPIRMSDADLSFAMNSLLDESKLVHEGSIVQLVQVNSQERNLYGGPIDAWEGFGKERSVVITFTDGRVRSYPRRSLFSLKWRPLLP